MNTTTHPERLAGVDYPNEQDLSIVGPFVVVALAWLLLRNWSKVAA